MVPKKGRPPALKSAEAATVRAERAVDTAAAKAEAATAAFADAGSTQAAADERAAAAARAASDATAAVAAATEVRDKLAGVAPADESYGWREKSRAGKAQSRDDLRVRLSRKPETGKVYFLQVMRTV